MEWTKDPLTGKFIVTFNNRTINCTTDADCDAPVGLNALCYSPNDTDVANYATWTDINQCACPPNLQFVGGKCDQFSAFTITMQATFIVALVLAVIGIAVFICDFVRLIRAKVRFKVDALTVTACSAFLGMVSMLVFDACIVAELFGFQYGYYPNSEKKYFDRNDISTPAAGFAFFFGTISCLNVSFAWIYVAKAVSSMTAKLQTESIRYKRLLLVYQTIFFSLVIYGSVIDNAAVFTLPLVPAFFFIAIVYLIAYRRISEVIRSVSRGGVNVSSSNKMGRVQQDALEKSLRSIRSTALLLVLNNCVAFIVLLTYFLLIILEPQPTPEYGRKSSLVSGFRWIVFVAFMLIITRYCHHSYSAKIKRASSPQKVEDHTPAGQPLTSNNQQRNQQAREGETPLMEKEPEDAIVVSSTDPKMDQNDS